MNLNAIKNVGTKLYMKVSKVSPELALGGAIACGIGAVVVGCLASRKVDNILEDANMELDAIQGAMEEAETSEEVKAYKKDVVNCYIDTGLRLAKLYAPTIALGTASIGLVLTSHGILNKRYVETLAAYQSINEAFKGYRKRVAATVGEEAEKVLMAGAKTEKNIKTEDEETGEVKTLKNNNLVLETKKNSPYEFDFNKATAPLTWEANPDYNDARLRAAQTYFNDILNTRGHVFLNEVLDELGLQRTPAGAVCGWVKGAGDDYIDFGYLETFLREYNQDSDLCKKNIHLNFNCDGVIWDMI